MDRLVSCRMPLLVLLAWTCSKTTVAGKVIFPDVEACTLRTGEEGRCLPLHDCPPVLQTVKETPPVSCGFDGFTQIVCCPKGQDTTTEFPPVLNNQLDISTPSGYNTLDCGLSAVKVIDNFSLLSSGGLLPSRQRRANAALPQVAKPTSSPVPPIAGGQVSLRDAWPWMGLIGERDAAGLNWFCGGALINEYWVLTALHCFHNNRGDVVRLGEHDYDNDRDQAQHQDFDVAEQVLYPDFKFPEAYHDLALLRLNTKVTLTDFIRPVCLPWGRKIEENVVNTTATITGWGHTLYGGFPSSVLMEAEVEVFPSSRCDGSYSTLPHYTSTWPSGIGEESLCAGDPDGGKDSCQGDSGGPMVTQDSQGRFVAAGVVSRGYGCGHVDYPGLYANLRHAPYLAWIKKVAFGGQ